MLALSALLATAVFAADPPPVAPGLPAGNYFLELNAGPEFRSRYAVVRLETTGGKPTIRVVHTGPPQGTPPAPVEYSATDLAINGTTISFVTDLLKPKGATFTFEGVIDPKTPGVVLGSYGKAGTTVKRAYLTATDKAEFGADDKMFQVKLPAEVSRAIGVLESASYYPQLAARTKDPVEKAKYEKTAAWALGESEKSPGLLRQALVDHPGTTAAAVAAQALLDRAAKLKATPAEVAEWVRVIEADAARHGARCAEVTVGNLAGALAEVDGVADLALTFAERAAAQKGLYITTRVEVLKRLAAAQLKAGKADAATATEREVAKLDGELDAEYLRTVPPFKPAPYAGRKTAGANRVAVVELFTGAQCPPCVGADVAFDAARQSYPAGDVILLQYHLNIPGPDPLTSPDSEARFEYYAALSGKDFGGTPATAFNGKPACGGGGGMTDAEAKFAEYRSVIDPALEQQSAIRLSGTATVAGDKLSVAVEVAGLADPKPTVKLRLVLVEETVKYAARNGLRFHHCVVRGLLDTADGVPVAELKGGKHAAEVSVSAVRDGLAAYLEKSNAERPFPDGGRPLVLTGLRVVALVQDDATGEILQAAPIPGGRGASAP